MLHPLLVFTVGTYLSIAIKTNRAIGILMEISVYMLAAKQHSIT